MNKKGKVLVAGAIALTIVGTTIPQNWHISAASNLISNDDFEEMKSEDIIPYSGTAGDMALSTWYSKNGGAISYTGYHESERSAMLPSNTSDTWIRQVLDVKKNTDYVFSVYVKTSLKNASAVVQVLDEAGNSIDGIDQKNVSGTEWQKVEIAFNSGEHSRVTVGVLKWTDQDDATLKSNVYVDDAVLLTKQEYEAYVKKEESKTKLVNYIGNSDLVSITDDDIQQNSGDTYSYEVGKFYYNSGAPITIGEGHGENAIGLVLPDQVPGDAVKAVAKDIKPNKDYLFKFYIKHNAEGTGTAVYVNGVDTTKLFSPSDEIGYTGGTDWKEYTIPFNTQNCTDIYVDIYKDGINSSTVNISDMRVYESSVYDKYLEEKKEEESEEENNQYTEVWRDDFNTLDQNTWTYQLGHKRGIEPQDYVSNRENVFVEDGNLYLRATEKEKYRVQYNSDGSDIVKKYDSGSIATFGKKEFLYGKIEMRAKLPKGAGAFPAFWTLGNDFTLDGLVDSKQGVGWPMCGEIDIMELIGQNPDVPGTSDSAVHGTIHCGLTEDGDKAQTNQYQLKSGTFNDDYHTFGIIWNPETIEWYVDGNIYNTVFISDLDYFQKPHYLLLNLATGGAWPGFPNEDTEFPMDFVIDYISYSQTQEHKEAADRYYASAPTFEGVKDITISSEDQLPQILKDVKATDANGNPLEVSCSINDGYKALWNGKTRTSEIDFTKEGTYEIVYSTIGENNIYTRECATLHVSK